MPEDKRAKDELRDITSRMIGKGMWNRTNRRNTKRVQIRKLNGKSRPARDVNFPGSNHGKFLAPGVDEC
jgi:hypothetical protein